MYEDAGNGLADRFVTAVKKIIESIKEFFAKLKEKVMALYRDSKISALVSKAKEKLRKNPILARKKAPETISNLAVIIEVYEDEERVLNREAAVASTDNFDEDEFDEHRQKFQIEADKAEEEEIEVTVDEAVDELDDGIKIMDKVVNESKSVQDSIKSKADKVKEVASDTANKVLKVLKAIASTVKAKAKAVVAAVTDMARKVAKFIKGALEVADDAVHAGLEGIDAGASNYAGYRKAKRSVKRGVRTAQRSYNTRRSERAASLSESTFDCDGYLDYLMGNINESTSYDCDDFDIDSFLD
jgi:hypothetical protein